MIPKSLRTAVAIACLSATLASSARADEREPRVHTYSAGVGYEITRFRLEDGARMGASGPQVNFNYSVGRRWGFALRGGFTFPLHGSQALSGQSGYGLNTASMYDSQRISFDTSFLVIRRLHLNPHLDLVVGGGINIHTLRLVSSVYNPIELISGGFAGLARLERMLDDRFFYGGELTMSFDPLDFIHHNNRAVFVAPIALGAFIGVRR